MYCPFAGDPSSSESTIVSIASKDHNDKCLLQLTKSPFISKKRYRSQEGPLIAIAGTGNVVSHPFRRFLIRAAEFQMASWTRGSRFDKTFLISKSRNSDHALMKARDWFRLQSSSSRRQDAYACRIISRFSLLVIKPRHQSIILAMVRPCSPLLVVVYPPTDSVSYGRGWPFFIWGRLMGVIAQLSLFVTATFVSNESGPKEYSGVSYALRRVKCLYLGHLSSSPTSQTIKIPHCLSCALTFSFSCDFSSTISNVSFKR